MRVFESNGYYVEKSPVYMPWRWSSVFDPKWHYCNSKKQAIDECQKAMKESTP